MLSDPGRPRVAPAPSSPGQPERTHANEREGGRWRIIPAENRIRAGTGAPFARRKEQHHILYGNEHVTYHISVEHTAPHRLGRASQNDHRPHPTGGKARNDDITTNKRQQPYHTSVEHTAPRRRGGANQKTTGPIPQGGRGRGQTNKTRRGKQQAQTRQLQGGTPWGGGGGGGGGSPASYVYIYIHIYIYIYIFIFCLFVRCTSFIYIYIYIYLFIYFYAICIFVHV